MDLTVSRKVPSKLASARAYWRVAAKFERAGQYRQAKHYREVAERFHRGYLRDQEYLAKMKEGKS